MTGAVQLPLWEEAGERVRRLQIERNRLIDDFIASLNLGRLESVCLRCGTVGSIAHISTSHDLGWCGCPNEFDPAWSKLPKGPGFQSVIDNGKVRSHLTEAEMADRWDATRLPLCVCGHAIGLHSHGMCSLYCGCQVYEASAPMTVH